MCQKYQHLDWFFQDLMDALQIVCECGHKRRTNKCTKRICVDKYSDSLFKFCHPLNITCENVKKVSIGGRGRGSIVKIFPKLM